MAAVKVGEDTVLAKDTIKPLKETIMVQRAYGIGEGPELGLCGRRLGVGGVGAREKDPGRGN